ncbi:MAG: alkaline phosphatase family protein [Sphingomonadales bacterium]|nr:alkaline phosphatase family protein [Sphingomonadales bacterium]MBD3774774.1 alkaline phosphatase family protein [Paracoccaceae bacterium]
MRLLIALVALFCLSGPVLAAEADDRPVTILVSIDGFRADYLDRGVTPNLVALAARGATGPMRPSFPTKTFPNHYTLVTGLRPDRHGIVGNSMIDPRRPGQMFTIGDAKQALDPFWWDEAEPLWITAEKAGMRTATAFWPGSEVPFGGVRPHDWLRFDYNITNRQRIDIVLDWIRRPSANRPAFVTLYFDTVDTAGHKYGPDSDELNAAIAEVDARIGDLVAGLAAMDREANLVIVSDHGMQAVSADRVVQLDELIDSASYIPVVTGSYAAIEPVTGTDSRVADALLGHHDHMQCYRREDLPARLAYGKNPRVAAIMCLADAGWSIVSGPQKYAPDGGAHGYDNADPDMLALFIASGPAFRKGAHLPMFDNVDVAPLLRAVLGLPQLETLDGHLADLEPALAR